eukprot:scaffold16691_cov19-Tisochrysis_lutea.AAC.1
MSRKIENSYYRKCQWLIKSHNIGYVHDTIHSAQYEPCKPASTRHALENFLLTLTKLVRHG